MDWAVSVSISVSVNNNKKQNKHMSAKTKTKRNKIAKTKTELDFEKAKQELEMAKQELEMAKQDFAIATSIYKSNTAYDKASESKRRVMIAEDALHQLKIGRFLATPGTYVCAMDLAAEAKIEEGVQLNTLLHNPALKSSCDVCARGALLLSAVRFRNDCIIHASGETSEDSWVREFKEQQEKIEAAFENYGVKDDNDNDAGNPWCNKFLTKKERENPTNRLELILKNIIRNKGTFKASQR